MNKSETKEEVKTGIQLPTTITKATQIVPKSLILFGLPKSGKTTGVATLPNSLLIDVENGSDFIDATKIKVDPELGPVGKFNWLKDVAREIKAQGHPYDFVVIDTLSYLDEISEFVGTYDYCQSIQGKKWNRDANGTIRTPEDPEYQSVLTMGEGYGYRFSRNAMTKLFDELKNLGKISTIFIVHVADKYVLSKQSNQEVRVMDLSLTGKLKHIFSRDVDGIGYVYNKDGKLQISFKGGEERTGGIRGASHIQGFEGELDWNKIFLLDTEIIKKAE